MTQETRGTGRKLYGKQEEQEGKDTRNKKKRRKRHRKQEEQEEETQENERNRSEETHETRVIKEETKESQKNQEERDTGNKEPERSYAVRIFWKEGNFAGKFFYLEILINWPTKFGVRRNGSCAIGAEFWQTSCI